MAGASMAIGVAQGAVGFFGQQKQYKQQLADREENRLNAGQALTGQWAATDLRINQEGAAAAQQGQQAAVEGARARATATTAAGEGGVSGLSVDYLLRDLYAQEGRFNEATATNLQMTRSYLTAEKSAQRAGAQNQINSIPIPEKPSIMGAMLNVFGSALGSYTSYKSANP